MATLDVTQSPYNADDTGATDAAADIQSALDDATSGDTVLMPGGESGATYLLDNGAIPLNIEETEDGVTFEADGPDLVTLQMAGGFSANHRGIRIDSSGDSSGSLSNITIRGFAIDGNKANQSSSNGIGVAMYQGGGSDTGLVIENVRAQNWTNSGIQVTRGGTARYCDGINNGSHGIATQGGNSQGGTLVEWCECWGNGQYGLDLHGLSTAQDCYLHDNVGGFKNGDAATTGDYTYKRLWVVNCSSIGYQATETFTSAVFEDVLIDGTDSWGMRFDNGGDVYIRGTGIKCTDINRDENNIQGVGFYTVTMVDEAGDESILRVDTAGNGTDPAVGKNGGNSGTIDTLYWLNCSQAVVDFGGSLSFDTIANQSVGNISNLPTDGETGTEGFSGGGGGGGSGGNNAAKQTTDGAKDTVDGAKQA